MYYDLSTAGTDSWGAYHDITTPTQKSAALATIAAMPLSNFTTCQ